MWKYALWEYLSQCHSVSSNGVNWIRGNALCKLDSICVPDECFTLYMEARHQKWWLHKAILYVPEHFCLLLFPLCVYVCCIRVSRSLADVSIVNLYGCQLAMHVHWSVVSNVIRSTIARQLYQFCCWVEFN